MWLCTRCNAHKGDLHRNALAEHCVIWQVKFYKIPQINRIISKRNHFGLAWHIRKYVRRDIYIKLWQNVDSAGWMSTTMPWRKLVVIYFFFLCGTLNKCDSSESQTEHLSLCSHHTENSPLLMMQQLIFCVGTAHPPPLCQSAQLFTFFFLSKDVCGFRNSGQGSLLPLCTADLCGTRGPTEKY